VNGAETSHGSPEGCLPINPMSLRHRRCGLFYFWNNIMKTNRQASSLKTTTHAAHPPEAAYGLIWAFRKAPGRGPGGAAMTAPARFCESASAVHQ